MTNFDETQKVALILIDVQKGFHDPSWGKRNNPKTEENIKLLLDFFRKTMRPIIHIQHLSQNPLSPLRPGQLGVEFMEEAMPQSGERIFQKKVNSAFIGTSLKQHLRSKRIEDLIMVGFTSDHCVSTTARMGANLGFNIIVVKDATATFERRDSSTKYPPDLIHDVSMASLMGEFAEIVNTQNILGKQWR